MHGRQSYVERLNEEHKSALLKAACQTRRVRPPPLFMWLDERLNHEVPNKKCRFLSQEATATQCGNVTLAQGSLCPSCFSPQRRERRADSEASRRPQRQVPLVTPTAATADRRCCQIIALHCDDLPLPLAALAPLHTRWKLAVAVIVVRPHCSDSPTINIVSRHSDRLQENVRRLQEMKAVRHN